ncbi:hypothetical protein QYE76_061776 [Lolium multiflorum]|uniref:Uncharacterized protein n=1 Tax=Lolium multiflorum TaxID=4521 RepID=A0AAD8S1E7_LOLMU|nr:hypothetical protein QYE76_061776 [Lolium multiflorum]
MENYSLLMGAAAVMKMAVEMAAVSMEKPSGGTSPLRQGNRGHANTSTEPRTSRDYAKAAACDPQDHRLPQAGGVPRKGHGWQRLKRLAASSAARRACRRCGPEKPFGLLGRIVELKREGKDLGHLLPYAQKWNDADISAATRGLGKDRLPAPDPAGPRSTEEHFTRLKHAVKEFDSAWYDATKNVVSTADARKALFEELLWEHRNLAEAHSKCQAIPEASIEALKAQVAALQAEKEQLIRDHQKALDAQKEISRELKDQAIQAGVRHAEELKAAESAAEARLNEALEDAGNANVVLQAGLEEATKALKTAEGKAAKAHKAAAEAGRSSRGRGRAVEGGTEGVRPSGYAD